MNEYKSVLKYLGKDKSKKSVASFFQKLGIKILICVVLLLVVLIVLKVDKNSNQVIYKYLYEHNINFAYINKIYQKYLGDILPFQSITNNSDSKVFNEHIAYNEASIYKNGVMLEVGNNYLVPLIESGVVVFVGEKEDFNKTVIVQQVDGVNVWYGNVSNINVDLYDYVSKGEFLGETNSNKLYMLFEKDGKYLNYKEYLK